MNLNIATAYAGLLTIANPFNDIPTFLALTAGQSANKRRATAAGISLAVAVIFTVALFLGEGLLRAFSIDLDAFRFAGGLVLAILGMNMLNSSPDTDESLAPMKELPIVPLAIPALAGPGALSFVIAWNNEVEKAADYGILLIAIVLVSLTVLVVFGVSPLLARVLGHTGLNIMTKIFGLLLLALAVGLAFDALGAVFPGLLA